MKHKTCRHKTVAVFMPSRTCAMPTRFRDESAKWSSKFFVTLTRLVKGLPWWRSGVISQTFKSYHIDEQTDTPRYPQTDFYIKLCIIKVIFVILYYKITNITCTSSSRMHVMNHNWSATKQHLPSQSVAEISRH